MLVGEVVLQLGEGLREPGREQLEASEGVVDVRGAGQSVTAGLGHVVQPAKGFGRDVGLPGRLAGHRGSSMVMSFTVMSFSLVSRRA